MSSPESQPKQDNAMYSILLVLNDLFGQAIQSAFPDVPDAPVLVALSSPVLAATKGIDYQCNSALPIMQTLKARGKLTLQVFAQ